MLVSLLVGSCSEMDDSSTCLLILGEGVESNVDLLGSDCCDDVPRSFFHMLDNVGEILPVLGVFLCISRELRRQRQSLEAAIKQKVCYLVFSLVCESPFWCNVV